MEAGPPPFFPELARQFRAPAYPLVTHDPYFSIWSFGDTLGSDWSRHWTGAINAMASMVRIDGEAFHLMGALTPAKRTLTQDPPWVFPTRTVYRYFNSAIRLDLVFESPLLPGNIDVLSRPVSYITWTARSMDNKPHAVSVYFDSSAELVVNTPSELVTWDSVNAAGLVAHRIGTSEQPVLLSSGDDRRINWGYLYHAARADTGAVQRVQSDVQARQAFAMTGQLAGEDDANKPRAASNAWPVVATVFDLGAVGAEDVSRTLLLAYDDIYSVAYMNEPLQPYWRKTIPDAETLLKTASEEHDAIDEKCRAFDDELMTDLHATGGDALLQIGTLAFRQAIAAHKVVRSPDGKPWFFSKENFSNGCIATVDVTYPSSPLFLLMQPKLLEGMLDPVMKYASSSRWTFPFAPHDLGTYPLANGQVYGGGETSPDNQMPVEESANLIILTAALTKATDSTTFAEAYFPVLTKWAEYLKTQGLDPENQLSTDDFAGHLAHNVNLSAKAIVALGAYASLCERTNRSADAASYRALATSFAEQWAKNADDGDHFRLAFDQMGTWSQKYNLAMDLVLQTGLFKSALSREEMDYYLTRQNGYGLPLDVRATYTKLDWIVWTSTLTGEREDLDALLVPVSRFLTETPNRVPMTDWFDTLSGHRTGFQARSVVGGVFMPLLLAPNLWQKWLSKAQ